MPNNIMPSKVPEFRTTNGSKRIVHQSMGLWQVVTYKRVTDTHDGNTVYLEKDGYSVASAYSPFHIWAGKNNNIERWVAKVRKTSHAKIERQRAIAHEIVVDCDDLYELIED